MHICLSGICWVWKRFPDWVEKWSLQLRCNFNLENEWMDPVQSFGWDPVFKIHRTMSMWLHSQLVSDLGRESVKILVTFLHLSKLRPIQETQTACKCGLYTKGSVCVCVCVFFNPAHRMSTFPCFLTTSPAKTEWNIFYFEYENHYRFIINASTSNLLYQGSVLS